MPWPNYRPPPAPPAPKENQTVLEYGSSLVAYLIANPYTQGFTDDQIETADHAIGWLLGRQARPDETIAPCYFETLNACRRRLTYARAARAETRERAERMHGAPAPAGEDDDDGGQKEPRRPYPPAKPAPTAHATPSTPAPQSARPQRAAIDF